MGDGGAVEVEVEVEVDVEMWRCGGFVYVLP